MTTSFITGRELPRSAEIFLSDADRHEIQVSGNRCFPVNEWRNAILYYLFGVWGNKDYVMYRPKMNFAGVSLRLDPERRCYYLQGRMHVADVVPVMADGERIVLDSQDEVETGLVRFVKDESIKKLTIQFRDGSQFFLWKKERRGEYGVHAYGILSEY